MVSILVHRICLSFSITILTVDDLKQPYCCHKCEDNHNHQAKKSVKEKKKSINENLEEKERERNRKWWEKCRVRCDKLKKKLEWKAGVVERRNKRNSSNHQLVRGEGKERFECQINYRNKEFRGDAEKFSLLTRNLS